MIVYRNTNRKVGLDSLLVSIRRRVKSSSSSDLLNYDWTVDLLIVVAEMECAFSDVLGERASQGRYEQLRCTTIDAAQIFLHSWKPQSYDGLPPHKLLEDLDKLRELTKPDRILSVPTFEGLAYYNLLPETYADAAEKFAADHKPRRAICIGIRSIGTLLSAIVTATLQSKHCTVNSFTLRPEGHPFERTVQLSKYISETIQQPRNDYFLIVDEGPGLSGSTFASVVEMLQHHTVPQSKIFLFPSWNPAPEQLSNTKAQSVWKNSAKYLSEIKDVWSPPPPETIDFSAGLWRPALIKDHESYPPVQAQHEAVKYLYRENSGSVLMKFSGLGGYGSRKVARGEKLAQAKWSPEILRFEHGFIHFRFVPGELVIRPYEDDFLLSIAEYLKFVKDQFPSDSEESKDEIKEMTETNLNELGFRFDFAEYGSVKMDCTNVDGRMLPYKWIDSGGRFLKTDSLDHHCGHFFPGATSILWDVGSVCVEFDLRREQEQDLLTYLFPNDASAAKSLRFFKLAYLAFRAGYCKMQSEVMDAQNPEQKRFVHQAQILKQKLNALFIVSLP